VSTLLVVFRLRSRSRALSLATWRHNVQSDYKTHQFYDAEYVRQRVGTERVNILAVLDEPSVQDVNSFVDGRFVFRGFDLLEDRTGISALLNCGGFDKAFRGHDLSECGLLTNLATARHVQIRLRTEYPNEPHAECNLWAIWQMKRDRVEPDV
jgi:hypothetical protein